MVIRYGLIGSGMMGQEHIRNIQLLEGTEITAVADPDSAMRELSSKTSKGSARLYSDYHEMLRDDLCDVYLIVSPNDTHYQILLDAIPRNKPILCEKPLCTTVDQCRKVINLAKGRTAPVWVAMEYRYMPPVQRLLEEVQKGTAGPPQMMSIREHRFPFLEKVGNWNRFNKRTGGTLTEKCCHFWDLMRLTLMSDPIRVFASGAMDTNHLDERYDGQVPDIIDNAYVIVDFENGTRAMLDLCMFAEGSYWQEHITVTGSKARVEAYVPGPSRFRIDGNERPSQLRISDRKSKSETIEEVLVDESILKAGDHHGSSYYQHQKFLDMVRNGGKKPEVSLVDGLWSVLVGEAAELSARTGQAILIDQI
ncbi:MAG: myo-inositol 2-dehydrogenase/D-chiro-inositol 1-dehydrogenase [Gammaproteobacteria bacterium]|jgi:myo-inositol 2-dehydrogenase/D-chiro-inositol 1-dehydrogenase